MSMLYAAIPRRMLTGSLIVTGQAYAASTTPAPPRGITFSDTARPPETQLLGATRVCVCRGLHAPGTPCRGARPRRPGLRRRRRRQAEGGGGGCPKIDVCDEEALQGGRRLVNATCEKAEVRARSARKDGTHLVHRSRTSIVGPPASWSCDFESFPQQEARPWTVRLTKLEWRGEALASVGFWTHRPVHPASRSGQAHRVAPYPCPSFHRPYEER